MRDNYQLLLAHTGLRIHAIFSSDRKDEFRQTLEHIGRRVISQAISPTITRHINRNERRRLLERRRAQNIAPDGPAIGETMDKDNHGFLLIHRGSLVVANVVKLEPILQAKYMMRKAVPILGQVPELVAR